ncbi:uncharacterized protein PgNI_04828 [Pyricularia grisea]|uniref:Peptidase C15, pyroglutamyl peptidase I-like protein n=1 Tax=Pyricularia grisea TaxID=148305 RepID=A0A6P8BDB2_PYRGI|nr:uncharacterized protein PgNI_04828 [Pyricularia grisea]TLD13825.1 hypothetical protein PgNI_04828 [Pyricularia grisea]
MGSSGSLDPEELTVVVTGFGPFREEYPVNPAWEITRLLPDYLPPPPGKTAMQHRRSDDDTPPLPPVRIQKYPSPIRVNYQTVRELVPTLWGDKPGEQPAATAEEQQQQEGSGVPKIDLMIHIGMAGPRRYHSIERRGHRDGYRGLDVDGLPLADEERHAREGEKWIWHGLPREIETDLLLDDVLDRWKGYVPWDADVRVSEDAGRYLCDFIYYSSLAHLYRKGDHRRVVFLHVPVDVTDEALRKGVDLTLQLIRSALESERSGLAAERREKRARKKDDDERLRALHEQQQRAQWQQDQELREQRQRERDAAQKQVKDGGDGAKDQLWYVDQP